MSAIADSYAMPSAFSFREGSGHALAPKGRRFAQRRAAALEHVRVNPFRRATANVSGRKDCPLRRAMTLVELLVVLTIVMLLAAATIPRLKPEMERSRVREAARAIQLYSQFGPQPGDCHRPALWRDDRAARGRARLLDATLASRNACRLTAVIPPARSQGWPFPEVNRLRRAGSSRRAMSRSRRLRAFCFTRAT